MIDLFDKFLSFIDSTPFSLPIIIFFLIQGFAYGVIYERYLLPYMKSIFSRKKCRQSPTPPAPLNQ